MRGHGTRADNLCVRRIVEMSPTLRDSMIVWFQFERQDGTLVFGSDPLARASLSMASKYSTVTLPASQCLFFRGENYARSQSAAVGVVKAHGYQAAAGVAHPYGRIALPFNLRAVSKGERDAVQRLSRLVSA
jgi:hypothetical protein